jgi:uncharacterized DUF497 family protein
VIFAWDEWNREHIAEHNVSPAEAEYVVRKARRPYPMGIGDDKHLVWGGTEYGRILQVIYSYRSHEKVTLESLATKDLVEFSEHKRAVVYVVHARDLTVGEKSRFKRRRK